VKPDTKWASLLNESAGLEEQTQDLGESQPKPDSIESITHAVSALKFIPSSIRFGSKGQAGFARPRVKTPKNDDQSHLPDK
jgi:hypothetical protein